MSSKLKTKDLKSTKYHVNKKPREFNFVTLFVNLLKNIKTNDLKSLIFFVTSKCNLRCKTCFNWQSLGVGNELTLDEIKKISEAMPEFDDIVFSGGEPFLRKDLADIVGLFVKNNKIKGIIIPTNGLLQDAIFSITRNILDRYPKLQVLLSFSIDGLELINDQLRGVEGAFSNAIDSTIFAKELQKEYPNLSLNINTVICFENYKQIPSLISFLKDKELGDVTHSFEIIRGNVSGQTAKVIPPEELRKTYNEILNYKERIFEEKIKNNHFKKLLKAFHYANIMLLYSRQFRNYTRVAKWGFPCIVKKRRIIVIEHEGTVKLCELKDGVGNLRDFNYDFEALYNSRLAVKRRAESKGCVCTHICFILHSMYSSYFAIFILMPLYFIKYFINKKI